MQRFQSKHVVQWKQFESHVFSLAKHKLKQHVFSALDSLQDGQSLSDREPKTLNINMKKARQASSRTWKWEKPTLTTVQTYLECFTYIAYKTGLRRVISKIM